MTEASYLARERESGTPERLIESRTQDYRKAKKEAFAADPAVAALVDRIKGGLTKGAYVEELRAKGVIGIGSTATASEKARHFDLFDAATERLKNPVAAMADAAKSGWGIFAGAAGAGARPGGPAAKGAGGLGVGKDYLGHVMKSLRLSIGPKATISGLESVGRSAQLAALNNDPLDRAVEQLQLKALERIEKTLVERLPKGAAGDRPGLGEGK